MDDPLLARIEQQGMAIAHQREELRRLRAYNMQAAAVMLRDPPGLIIDAIFDTGIAMSLNDVRAICAAIADVIQGKVTLDIE